MRPARKARNSLISGLVRWECNPSLRAPALFFPRGGVPQSPGRIKGAKAVIWNMGETIVKQETGDPLGALRQEPSGVG